MATEIAKAYVQIIPSTQGISGALEKEIGGVGIGEKAGKSIAGGIGKGIASATGLIATGMTAVSGAIVKGVSETAEYADNIDKMSQKLGLSAQAYQEWDFIAQHSGTSVDGLQASMKTLANAAQDGKDAFGQLGLSVEEVQSMTQEDLFATVVERLQSMGESTERTAIASDLLGKSATELAPLLNTSAEATAEMRKQAHDLGGVLSDDAVKAGAAFQDSLQNLQTAIGGMKNKLSADFLPSVTNIIDGLTALATGDNSGIGLISDSISNFLEKIISTVPKVADAAVEIMMNIVDVIAENLPKLVDGGVDIIMKLIEGITKAIPNITESLPTIITEIVTTIASNLPKIIEMGGELLVSLVTGLLKAIPMLIKNIPQIIVAIVNGLKQGIGSLMDVGLNLVKGLWNGISDATGWLLDKIRGFGQSVLNGIKDIFDIHSPSKEMAWIGEMLDKGLANGISGNVGIVKNAMGDVADATLSSFTPTIGKIETSSANYTVPSASPQMMSQASGVDSGKPIILQVTLDGKVVGETAWNYNRQRARAMG